jgi:hypothetical protein
MDPNENPTEPLWCPLHRMLWPQGECQQCAMSDTKLPWRAHPFTLTEADENMLHRHHEEVQLKLRARRSPEEDGA